ncbi:hypothetical protein SXANM310S_00044 [Streptomyces xanthochromogenes]
MVFEDQDPEVAEPVVAGGRQRHVVCHAERQRVRPGHDIEQERQVPGRARHRSDHGEVQFRRQGRRGGRHHPAGRREPDGRLVCVDTTEVCRGAKRSGEVGADGQRAEPGRQGRGRSAGGSTRRTTVIPGVVGGAVDPVEGLDVLQPHGHVGLAEHDRARGLEPGDLYRVLGRQVVAVRRHAPSGGQSGDVVRLLDRHRDAEQRSDVAAGACLVRVTCRGPGAVEVRHTDRVDRLVVPLDARDRFIGQLRRGHFTGAQGSAEFFGCSKVPVHDGDRTGGCEKPRNVARRNGVGTWNGGVSGRRRPPTRVPGPRTARHALPTQEQLQLQQFGGGAQQKDALTSVMP